MEKQVIYSKYHKGFKEEPEVVNDGTRESSTEAPVTKRVRKSKPRDKTETIVPVKS